MRHALLFEDHAWRDLYPITLSRPTFDCRVGVTTLGRRLAAQLTRHGIRRTDLLCRPVLRPGMEREYTGHLVNGETPGDVVFLNGRLLCLGDGLKHLLELLDKSVVIQDGGAIAAVRVRGEEAAAYAAELARALSEGEAPPLPRDRSVVGAPRGVRLIQRLWDLVDLNAEVIEDDFAWMQADTAAPTLLPGAQTLHRDRIRCREDVRVEAGAILDAGPGPIFVGEGVHVQHNAVVLGPAYLGPRSVINVGAKIEGPVSLGPVCKVGGEVASSIVLGYSNKQHDGFLGHAYVGSWVNLGAATDNSDLKNNYAPVRVWAPGGAVDTGLRFVGVFLGDHVKTAIGTKLNTGTVVGFSSNVFGSGFPPKHVPSFSWGGSESLVPHDLDKALATARTVLERRGVAMEPSDEVLFREIARVAADLENGDPGRLF